MAFRKSGGHVFEKNTIYLRCIRTQSETKCFRHIHQVKMSKTNTKLHEIEYYLEYILRKVNSQYQMPNECCFVSLQYNRTQVKTVSKSSLRIALAAI